MFLAGDIGGTKTHLALYDEKGGMQRDQKFPSKSYSGLKEIVAEFLQGESPQKACFGIAGPVKDNCCRATNLPWVVDGSDLGVPQSVLINDLEANAWGIKALKKDELHTLCNEGEGKGNQALISAGTGLGEAGLYYDGKKTVPFACEGGHCDFAPRNAREIHLLQYLMKKFGHASYERVLSGPGLENLYDFLVEEEKMHKEPQVEEGKKEGQAPKAISQLGVEKRSETCVEALNFFCTLYGAEAGNLALKMMAFGGVFIGGGIAPKILPVLEEPFFKEAFSAKGRFKDLLEGIQVQVILNDNTALLGAMYFAKEEMS